MYDEMKTRVKIIGGYLENFLCDGATLGSTLSLFSFSLVKDELTRRIQGEVSWYMLLVDEIILIEKNCDEINVKIEVWKWTLESKGFRLSRINIQHLVCKFNDVTS